MCQYVPCTHYTTHKKRKKERVAKRGDDILTHLWYGQGLLKLKASIPKHVFRTGDLEKIVPRLMGYDSTEQPFYKGRHMVPMKPQLVDPRIQITNWHISPPLPPGFELNRYNGMISGSLPFALAPATYSITAENAGGRSQDVTICIEVLLEDSDVKILVDNHREQCSSRLMLAGVEGKAEPTDEASLDAVLCSMQEACEAYVKEAKLELDSRFQNMSQQQEIIDRVTLVAKEQTHKTEIQIREKYLWFATAHQNGRLELERADHEIQKMLLVLTKDYQTLSKHILHLEKLNLPDGAAAATTLVKARQRQQEIKPADCENIGCDHSSPLCDMYSHTATCLFGLTLMPQSAVIKSVGNCDKGFTLVATGKELTQYAGEYESGPMPFPVEDEKPNFFHWLDQENDRINRIKHIDGHWILSSKVVPENPSSMEDIVSGPETEIIKGEVSDKVDGANFDGFSIVAKASMSWAATWEKGKLVPESVKLIYFGINACIRYACVYVCMYVLTHPPHANVTLSLSLSLSSSPSLHLSLSLVYTHRRNVVSTLPTLYKSAEVLL